MLQTQLVDDNPLKTEIPELSTREFDTYLAAELLSPSQLSQITAAELVVLRAKLRSYILTSPEVRDALKRQASEIMGELQQRKKK